MANPLTLKLEQFVDFSAEDRRRLDEIARLRRRTFAPRQDIFREGDGCDDVLLILSGMAVRYKDLPNGGRQILAFMIPGDLCDIEVFVLDRMDHSIGAVSHVECAIIPVHVIEALLSELKDLTRALWWSTMTDLAVLRQHVIDHGRRDARERLAHLFYELLVRYRMVGLARDNSYALPLTQEELAEATGLTSVHVNRMLQSLRADGLIEHRHKTLTVLDPAGLKKVAAFETQYLHLKRAQAGDEPPEAPTSDLIESAS